MSYTVTPNRALPLDAYDADAAAADQAAIWRGGWVFVATSDQVADPGDHLPIDVGGQPVILLRSQDGELRALSNLCAHRGTLLIDEPGTMKRFQCPYHAWTYADDGRLLSVPFAESDDLDKDEHCLPTYRAEEWNGLVFVSLNPDVAPLAERFAHLAEIVAPHGLDRLRHWTSQRGDEIWEADWKLIITNAMESYHLFKVHPETLEPYSPTSGAYYIAGSADGTATGGASTRGDDDYVLLSLPPNLVGVFSQGAFLWQAVFPAGPGRSRVITGGAYRSADPAESGAVSGFLKRSASAVADAVVPDFLPEDKWICERGQRATTGTFEPGVLLPVEQVVIDFHHYLARQLHGTRPPAPATSATVGLAKDAAGD